MSEFNLPDVGEGLTEAEIVTWRVSVGDTVKVNDILVDIETAKSIVELPSPYAGLVHTLLVSEGDTVQVGTPIISIGEPAVLSAFGRVETAGAIVSGVPDSAPAGEAAGDAITEPPAEKQEMLVGYGPRADALTRRRPRVDAPQTVASVDTEKVAQPASRPLAKPPVRKLAKDLGVDLADVPADGPVVTRADVHAYVESLAPSGTRVSAEQLTAPVDLTPPVEPVETSTPVPSTPGQAGSDGDVRVPVKGVRKWTAEAMVRSAFTAPHVTEWVTLDVTRTMDLVTTLKADRAFAGVKVSPTLIAAKAVCLAMRHTPELNARWDEEAQEIVMMRSVNLGIAAATERGLVVPNIVDAGSMSLVDLAGAIGALTTTAREGRTQPAQMAGGTFSLTNIGVFGIDAGTPILNPGESGILALGTVDRRPWVDEHDQVVPAWVTTLALSFDHRVVDGEQGSRFLADVAAIMRDPALALTY